MEHLIELILPQIIHLLELIGIFIIFVGSMKTFVHFLISLFHKRRYRFQLELGSALALGLEFKMGAEILKTVLIQDMQEIMMLGAIILLRGMLALLLHFEMKAEHGAPEGRKAQRRLRLRPAVSPAAKAYARAESHLD